MKKPQHSFARFTGIILGSTLFVAAGAVQAGIVDSMHDLGSASNATTHTNTSGTDQTDETCVFCHTPHKAASNTVPLWNKALGDGSSLTTYNSTTIDGNTNFVDGSDYSTSLACLSCHDGTQAMDNIINAPGSGGYDSTGGGSTGLSFGWTGNADVSGVMTGALTLLSTNLGDDHPVAIQYGGGNITTAASTATTADPDFGQVNVARTGQPTLKYDSTRQRWWFDTDDDAKMDSNEVRLYTRTVGGTTQPFVECASCHDPHNPDNGTFLRVANTSSAVCTACHNK